MKEFIKNTVSRLTGGLFHAKLENMETITPEKYVALEGQLEKARMSRDEKIRQMRKSDPDYWTYERLGAHWKMSRQNIKIIITGDPRKK